MLQDLISRSAIQAQKRAVAKTLCYRLFMLAITVTVAWLIVGDIGAALNIGVITNVVKTGTYYIYERAWDHITWGVSTPDPTAESSSANS
jgi:uncharacterized membrane protein